MNNNESRHDSVTLRAVCARARVCVCVTCHICLCSARLALDWNQSRSQLRCPAVSIRNLFKILFYPDSKDSKDPAKDQRLTFDCCECIINIKNHLRVIDILETLISAFGTWPCAPSSLNQFTQFCSLNLDYFSLRRCLQDPAAPICCWQSWFQHPSAGPELSEDEKRV